MAARPAAEEMMVQWGFCPLGGTWVCDWEWDGGQKANVVLFESYFVADHAAGYKARLLPSRLPE
jgi:hypothetical protein